MMPALEKIVSALSVTPTCPRCKRVIPSEDVNVANDLAFCRNCNLSHSLSALASSAAVDEDVDPNNPPGGAWFERSVNGVVIGATHRSFSQAFGLMFFCLFWNGIVSVFVSQALASTLRHLGLPLPAWFPVAKGSLMPVGFTIFLWLFLTPFIAVGLAMVAAFLGCLAGRTEIRIQGGEGVLFTGVGSLGFRKRFSTAEVKDVRIENRRWRDSDGDSRRRTQIVIDTEQRPLKFGSALTEKRRSFVAGVVKRELVRS